MQIGAYQLLEPLARSRTGVVHRAITAARREVALELLVACRGADPGLRRRFLEDGAALTRLRHAHLLPVYEAGEADGTPYLVTELVPGRTLAARIAEEGPLDPGEAAEVVGAVALGLQHAHEQGVLHRDVTPEHVLIGAHGQVLLTGFGLAKDLLASLPGQSRSGVFLGSPGYESPEQAQGDPGAIGPSTDVYGLGATLFAALTGRPPHEEGGDRRPPGTAALRGARPDLPRPLELLIRRCLAPEPGARPATAAEVSRELLRLGATPRAGGSGGPPKGALVGAAAVLLGALGLTAAIVSRAPTAPPQRPGPSPTASAASPPPTPERSPAASSPPPPPPSPPASPATSAPGRADEAVAAGVLAFNEQRDADALALAERALDLEPQHARALGLRGMCRLRSGAREEAARDAARALELDPQEPLGLVVRGVLAVYSGRAREGLPDLERALQLDPDRAGNWLARAAARNNLGDEPGALADLDRALALDPDLPQALELRGRLRLKRHDRGGLEDLNRAIARRPSTGALKLRALDAHQRRDGAAALADLDRALELDPRDASAHDLRGIVLSTQRRYAEALAASDAAVQLAPEVANYHANRGARHNDLKDYEAALVELQRALELDPSNTSAWIWRGDALEGLGRLEEARAAMDHAVELAPERSEPWLMRGQFLRRRGEKAAARSDLERALALNPSSPLAGTIRKMIDALGD